MRYRIITNGTAFRIQRKVGLFRRWKTLTKTSFHGLQGPREITIEYFSVEECQRYIDTIHPNVWRTVQFYP